MIARIVCFCIGAIVLFTLSSIFGEDKIANKIQIIEAISVFYTLFRAEKNAMHLHQIKKQLGGKGNGTN